jgi:hypothetical protein
MNLSVVLGCGNNKLAENGTHINQDLSESGS